MINIPPDGPQPPPIDWQAAWNTADHHAVLPADNGWQPGGSGRDNLALKLENAELRKTLADLTGVLDPDVSATEHISVAKAIISQSARRRPGSGWRTGTASRSAGARGGAVWDDPDLTYLVPGMIPDTGIGTVFGERSTWKCFLALHLIVCVVYGLGFLGYPVAGRAGAFTRVRDSAAQAAACAALALSGAAGRAAPAGRRQDPVPAGR